MKKLVLSLLFLSVPFASGFEFSLSLYTPVYGTSDYYAEDDSVDEEGKIGPGDISYLFKIDYEISEKFKLGVESGRYSYSAHYTGDGDYLTKSFTSEQPLALRVSYVHNKHMLTLAMGDLLLSDGNNHYDNNNIEGALEYSYGLAEKFSVNVRGFAVKGDDSANEDAITSDNSLALVGLTYTI